MGVEAETFWHIAWLIAGLLLLMTGLRVLRRQPLEIVQTYSWTDLGFGLFLTFGITIPMTIGWWGMVQRSFRPFTELPSLSSIGAILGLLFGLAILFGLGILIRSIIREALFTQWSTRRFLCVILGIGTGLKLAYVLLIDMTWHADFMMMWRLSGAIVEQGWPYTEETYQSFHLASSGVYGHLTLPVLVILQRCLPYFLPLVYLFGKSALVFELANVVALSLCALLTFSLARRWFGERVARGVLVLTLIVPETFFSAGISTHEIPGTLYLLASLWLLDTMIVRINQRFLGNLGLSVALGCAVVLMEIQRLTGLFWFLALGIYVVAHSMVRIRRAFRDNSREVGRLLRSSMCWVILILIIPWSVYHGLYQFLSNKGWVLSRSQKQLLESIKLAAFSDSWGNGTLSFAYDNYAGIYDGIYTYSGVSSEMSPEDCHHLAWHKLFSDVYYNPIERFGGYLRKSGRLYALGTTYFCYDIYPRIKPSSPIRGELLERGLRALNLDFVILFCPVFILGSLLLLWRCRMPDRLWPAVLVLSVLSLMLLILSECAPRYVYPIWFIGPLVIGAQFHDRFQVSRNPEKIGIRVRRLLPMMVVVLGVGLIGFAGFRQIARVSDIRMLDFSQWTEIEANYPLPCGDYLDSLQTDIEAKRHFQLTLAHGRVPKSGDVIKVSKAYYFKDSCARMFKVYAHSPYENASSSFAVEAFDVIVLINDRVVSRFPIADRRTARQIVARDIVPKNGSIKITFAVKANVDTEGVSWQDASLVYFEFAQLLRE